MQIDVKSRDESDEELGLVLDEIVSKVTRLRVSSCLGDLVATKFFRN
ncbi:MAG: hypothetical protein WBG58_09685 [Ignavibacteriaceae bacterium]